MAAGKGSAIHSAWGYRVAGSSASLLYQRLTPGDSDAAEGSAFVAWFLDAPAGSATTITPDAGVLALAGTAPRLLSALRPAVGALALAGPAPRLAAALTPAAGAMTIGQGAAPSIGGAAWGDTPGDGFFLLLL